MVGESLGFCDTACASGSPSPCPLSGFRGRHVVSHADAELCAVSQAQPRPLWSSQSDVSGSLLCSPGAAGTRRHRRRGILGSAPMSALSSSSTRPNDNLMSPSGAPGAAQVRHEGHGCQEALTSNRHWRLIKAKSRRSPGRSHLWPVEPMSSEV